VIGLQLHQISAGGELNTFAALELNPRSYLQFLTGIKQLLKINQGK